MKLIGGVQGSIDRIIDQAHHPTCLEGMHQPPIGEALTASSEKGSPQLFPSKKQVAQAWAAHPGRTGGVEPVRVDRGA